MKSASKVVGLSVLLGAILVISACSDPVQSANNDNRATDVDSSTEVLPDDGTILSNESTQSENTQLSADDKMINTLIRYRWVLVDALDDKGQPLPLLTDIKEQVTTSFNQRQSKNILNYSVGCNTMSAGYELKGDTLAIDNSMSTKMSCKDLDLVENRLNALMQGVSQVEFIDNEDSPTLTQTTDNAVTLFWRGKLTAKAKYGSKGETVFWAIDAQSTPCTSDSKQMCLQVRPIVYNDQGIKVHEGKRVAFAGRIDGYEHDENFEQVLRMHRYPLNPSNKLNSGNDQDSTQKDAKNNVQDSNLESSSDDYAYVLDTIVEQTSVQ
ncbi:META domain-containing protein [Psychrobacter sp. DM4]|uniref:META domain-containing protein n=1 Tax=Psychrobacter sp. DM4 TaxID=3440637 RepID=UPI003F4F9282